MSLYRNCSLSNANTANPVYTTTGLSPGTHTIYLKVEISDGEAVSPYTSPLPFFRDRES